MTDRLERFINLIAKTGDKLVVYDRHKPDESFVIVNLLEYERLAAEAKVVKDLTEDELIDKINRDITQWKEEQAVEPPSQAVSSFPSSVSPSETTENKPVTKSNSWTIPETRRRDAE
jgi:hypothetical protein